MAAFGSRMEIFMKIGASNYNLIKRVGVEKSIEILAKAGFDSIDYNLETDYTLDTYKLIREYSDEEFDGYFKNVKKIIDANGIEVEQTHAPYQWFITEYNSACGIADEFYNTAEGRFDFNLSERFFDLSVKSIRATSILGAKYIVIHPIMIPISMKSYEASREERKKLNMDFYTRLIPYLEKYGVKMGFENMFDWREVITGTHQYGPSTCSTPEEIIDYIESLNSDRFVACLDLGHMNLTGEDTKDTVDGAVLKLGKYLEVLHVHDTDAFEDLHVPPFMGNIDWFRVCKALKKIEYKGVFNFEVGGMYFGKLENEKLQAGADYLYSTGKFLTELIEA